MKHNSSNDHLSAAPCTLLSSHHPAIKFPGLHARGRDDPQAEDSSPQATTYKHRNEQEQQPDPGGDSDSSGDIKDVVDDLVDRMYCANKKISILQGKISEKDDKISAQEERIKKLQEDAQTKISALEEQLSVAQQAEMRITDKAIRLSREFNDYQEKSDIENSSFKTKRQSVSDQEDSIGRYREEMSILRSQLQECRGFTALQLPTISLENIKIRMKNIEQDIKALLFRASKTFSGSMDSEHEGAKLFFRRHVPTTAGQDYEVERHFCELANRFGAKHILRALLAAALREWVFESEFPSVDSHYHISEYMTRLRRKLLAQDSKLIYVAP
jgi:hypothetical protein